jgi:hypothetical protein
MNLSAKQALTAVAMRAMVSAGIIFISVMALRTPKSALPLPVKKSCQMVDAKNGASNGLLRSTVIA